MNGDITLAALCRCQRACKVISPFIIFKLLFTGGESFHFFSIGNWRRRYNSAAQGATAQPVIMSRPMGWEHYALMAVVCLSVCLSRVWP